MIDRKKSVVVVKLDTELVESAQKREQLKALREENLRLHMTNKQKIVNQQSSKANNN